MTIDYILSSINNFIAFFCLIWFLKKIHLFDNISFNFNQSIKGLLLGISLILFSIAQFYLIYLSTPNKTLTFNSFTIFSSILYCLSIGLWEELLCRGLLLTNMLKKWGNTKEGILASILLSSIIFGALHLISLLYANTFSAVNQVIYATVMGVLLGSIYIKTKSLVSVILLHMLFNFSAYLAPHIIVNSNGASGILFIIVFLFFILIWLLSSFFIILNISKDDVNKLLVFNKTVD